MVESRIDPSGSDPDLERALEDFVDWARQEASGVPKELPRLQGFGKPGDRIGDYELVRRLGVGGMGVVFEARQLSVGGRRVAVKLLRSVLVTEGMGRRFQREVETVAALEHRSIVPVVDACVDGGQPYYVMKYVDGVSCARLIRELRSRSFAAVAGREVRRVVSQLALTASSDSSPSGSRSAAWEEEYHRWVARVGLELAEALQFAHEHHVVHRDVKPANVMITPEGHAVLLDFGLASVDGDESLTRSGQFLGTMRYAAPEQVRGEQTDGRSDVFSLGATLYELLTLGHPFAGLEGGVEGSSGLQRTGDELPRPIGSSVPSDLRTILVRSMALAPRRRYESAGALASDLRAFLSHRPIKARPLGWWERAALFVRRHPRLVSAVAGVLVMVLAALVLREWRVRGILDEAAGLLDEAKVQALELSELRAELDELVRFHSADLRSRAIQRSSFEEARVRLEAIFERTEDLLALAEKESFLDIQVREMFARLYASRLGWLLEEGGDVLQPERLATFEERLREYGRAGAYTALLRDRGSVSVSSSSGVSVRIQREGAGASALLDYSLGDLPASFELEGGSYLAEVRTREGYIQSVPFLVRRAAARGEAKHIEVEFPEFMPPLDMVHIPAGEALIERDPAQWRDVEAFFIGRYEVTNGELASWCRELSELGFEGFVSGLEDRIGADPRRPARGFTPMEMSALVHQLLLVRPLPEGWVYGLPTRAEFIRAARGDGVRRFPWGDRFSWESAVNYYSLRSFPGDAVPEPAGYRASDVSPFGVCDLAGSVAEITPELYGPLPGEYVLLGGSFRSVDPLELSIDSRRRLANESRVDVGFRVVARRLAPWFRQPDRAEEPFEDLFQRADSAVVGQGWLESSGWPGTLRTRADEGGAGRIEGQRLVCEGGLGNFSESGELWHRIHVGTDCRVSGRVRSTIEAEYRDSPQASRQFHVSLVEGVTARDGQVASLRWNGLDEVFLFGEDGKSLPLSERIPVEEGFDFELLIRQGKPRLRLMTSTRTILELEPENPDGESQHGPREGPRARYLVLGAPSMVGARLEVDEIRVEPLP